MAKDNSRKKREKVKRSQTGQALSSGGYYFFWNF
jgi:hypothetical protein